MNLQEDISFETIAKDIVKTKKFNELKNEVHHGLTRYTHVMKVSKHTYKITKKLHMDYVSATRAALLHDYFTSKDCDGFNGIERWSKHPSIACINAKKEFDLNEKEVNAITAHMFPLGKTIPKYKESWVLTLVDKGVSTCEQYQYNWKNVFAVYFLFIINMILFGQK